MRIQFVPTANQKQTILDAFFYEVEQLINASHIRTDKIFLNNALLESTLMHSRILLDFYEKTSRLMRHEGKNLIELDDVLAIDYGYLARQVDIPIFERDRLNKELAHLTYSGANRTPENRTWDYLRVVFPILIRSKEFIEYLLTIDLVLDNPRLIEECNRMLRRIEYRLNIQ